MLASKAFHVVENYGVGGKTALKNSDGPIWTEEKFHQALHSEPDKVVIMFGTNDSKVQNWNQTAFIADYVDMITKFRDLDSKPDVFVMIPPPLA